MAKASPSTYLRWIESEIRKQKFGKDPASLYDPLRYIMSLGGKRLRPLLTLFAYSMYADDVKRVVPIATAVETFHNFTLLHDDIMDKAPLRRGMATVHEKWNTSTAILSGDVMLVKVYEMFLGIETRKLRHVLEAFNHCATEVCEGQQWDMEFESRERVSEKMYLTMIRQKTAALLGFSLKLGAILANAPAKDIAELHQFGIQMGIGFQLHDDLLDVYASTEKFGKQVGGDIISNKKTFLLITALAKAKGQTLENLNTWLAKKSFDKKKKIAAVTAIYDQLDLKTITGKKINAYFNNGFDALARTSAAPARKEALRKFASLLISREA